MIDELVFISGYRQWSCPVTGCTPGLSDGGAVTGSVLKQSGGECCAIPATGLTAGNRSRVGAPIPGPAATPGGTGQLRLLSRAGPGAACGARICRAGA